MDSFATPTPQPESKLEQAEETTSRFSKETLQNYLKEISQESEKINQVLPHEENPRDIKKELEELDKKQKKWTWLYIIWLLLEMKDIFLFFYPLLWVKEPRSYEDPLAEKMEKAMTPFILPGLIFGLIMELAIHCPYWMQIWAIKQKNLKRTNTAMKIMRIYIYCYIVLLLFCGLCIAFFDAVKEHVRSGAYRNSPFWNPYLDISDLERAGKREVIIDFLVLFISLGIRWFLNYGGGVKFRNYLKKREELLEIKEKEE